MQLFKDIEDRWRKDSVTEAKKGGSKAKKGARELKRLQCSVNYEGRKKMGEGPEGCSEGVEGTNLLSFYED